MKTLILLLFLATAAFSQDLPDKGDISEVKGKTKIYVVADDADATKHITKQIQKKKGLTVVNSADDAEIFFDYRTIERADQAAGIAGMFGEKGQLDIYYRKDGKKVIVWSDTDTGANPKFSLTKKAIKAVTSK